MGFIVGVRWCVGVVVLLVYVIRKYM